MGSRWQASEERNRGVRVDTAGPRQLGLLSISLGGHHPWTAPTSDPAEPFDSSPLRYSRSPWVRASRSRKVRRPPPTRRPIRTRAQVCSARRPCRPQEQLTQADNDLARMEQSRSNVRRQLMEAREQRDVVKTLCLNDKLTQLNVAITSAQERRDALAAAVKRGDARPRHARLHDPERAAPAVRSARDRGESVRRRRGRRRRRLRREGDHRQEPARRRSLRVPELHGRRRSLPACASCI